MASIMYFYIHKYFFLTTSLFQSYDPVKYSDNLIPIIMWGYSPLWPPSLQKPPSAFSLFLASWIQSQCRYVEPFLTCNCIFKLLEDSYLSSPWIPMWFVSPPYWCCLPAASLPHPHHMLQSTHTEHHFCILLHVLLYLHREPLCNCFLLPRKAPCLLDSGLVLSSGLTFRFHFWGLNFLTTHFSRSV